MPIGVYERHPERYKPRKPCTEEFREKMRKIVSARPPCTWGWKVGAAHKGKKRSPEAIKNMSGHPCSPEKRKKIGIANTGKVRSEETKAQLAVSCRAAMLGRTVTWGDKISAGKKAKYATGWNPVKGQTRTPEQCLTMSIARLGLPGRKKTAEEIQKIRLTVLKKIAMEKGPVSCRYSKRACVFFDELNMRMNLNGIHAENVGEFGIKSLGYWVDYYEPNLNLVIEWNEEKGHYRASELLARDIRRQLEIEKELGCHFIHIREKTFDQEKDIILARIRKIIAEIPTSVIQGDRYE